MGSFLLRVSHPSADGTAVVLQLACHLVPGCLSAIHLPHPLWGSLPAGRFRALSYPDTRRSPAFLENSGTLCEAGTQEAEEKVGYC